MVVVGEGYRTLARLNFLDWGRAPAMKPQV